MAYNGIIKIRVVIMMNPVEERLFDTYAIPILEEIKHFPYQELDDLLNSLPIDKTLRVDLFDRARNLYFQWSADAFVTGLHLGLSLLNNNIRRPGPEKG